MWLFGVVEHWNAELLGWHVARRGTRFETIQALGMAVRRQFGQLGAGAARGLALRHDHGSAFMADVFQKRIRFWGMAPSYTFVGEPETNGCRERLFRTLKERVVHRRILQTIDEVRDAVRDFVARYNTEWLIEKNGHRSPDAPIRSLTAGRKPNAFENDIRACITKRKVNGGTMSEEGRTARDVLLGLRKTCRKIGVSFYRYLGDRSRVPGAAPIPPLPDLVRQAATV